MIKERTGSLKVSVITVCYNSAAHIEWTIRSVLGQTYPNMEYIIVDGGSDDGTTGIIRKYEPRFNGNLKWISERDGGIYDAMNKGIGLAGGDIIAFINSDDFYSSPAAIEKMVSVFSADSSVEGCYCDLAYVARDDPATVKRLWIEPDNSVFSRLEYGWLPAHPSLFIRREVYEQYGTFDTRYRIAADCELMYRFIGKHGIKIAYLPGILLKMRIAGISNNSVLSILKANRECFRAMKANKIFPYLIFLKPLRKVRQLIRAKYKRSIRSSPFLPGMSSREETAAGAERGPLSGRP